MQLSSFNLIARSFESGSISIDVELELFAPVNGFIFETDMLFLKLTVSAKFGFG